MRLDLGLQIHKELITEISLATAKNLNNTKFPVIPSLILTILDVDPLNPRMCQFIPVATIVQHPQTFVESTLKLTDRSGIMTLHLFDTELVIGGSAKIHDTMLTLGLGVVGTKIIQKPTKLTLGLNIHESLFT